MLEGAGGVLEGGVGCWKLLEGGGWCWREVDV